MKNYRLRPPVVFLICATLLLVLGFTWYYNEQEGSYRQQVENTLLAIASTKAGQIGEWRKELLADGEMLMDRNVLIADIGRQILHQDTSLGQDTLRVFRDIQRHEGFVQITLVSPDGQQRLTTDHDTGVMHPEDTAAILEAVRLRRPVFSDLHRDDDSTSVRMALVVPLFVKGHDKNEPVAMLVMDIDVDKKLFPLVASWPIPSDSAETLLVRRDGDHVLFLNELRHRQDTALKLRIPLDKLAVPAVQAMHGRTGVFHGLDYRGIAVLSALVPIADSRWVMIAKIDESEAFAAWRPRALSMVILVSTMFGLVFVVFLVLSQRTRRVHFQELYLAENRLRASMEKQAVTLRSIGDAVIATDADGRVELVNAVAEHLTGWSQQEAAGRPLEEIFVIVNETSRAPVDNPVARILREGAVVGLANHTLLLHRNGREIPIADSGAPIRDENGEVIGVVLVFRDQSEERRAERLTSIRLSLIEYAADHDLDSLLTRTLDLAGDLIDSPIGFYHFMGEDQKTLTLQQWSTRTLLEFCQASGKGVHYNIDQAGIWVECVHRRKPVVHNDYESMTTQKGLPPGHARVVRELVVPVMRGDNIVAIMGMGNKPDLYTEEDVQLIAYLADVTWEIVHRKRMAQDLHESERRLATLLGNLPGMAYHCRYDGTWTMEYVSEGCEELTGYQQQELTGGAMQSYAEIIHAEDRSLVYEEMEAALSAQRPFVLTYRIINKNGQVKWVWEQGRAIHRQGETAREIEGFILDITERKQAELERERLLLAVEQTADTILITSPGGIVQYVNPAFESTTGYSREEILGRNPRVLKSGEQDKVFYQEMWQAIGSGRTWSGRLVNRRKDGTLFTEEATISPVLDGSGRITNYVAVKRDITEHLRLSQQMQQAQKMEAVGRLAGGVAHDFNNMLAVIIGFAGLAIEKVIPEDPLHEDLQEILTAANRSADITRQLLAFARKQTIAPQVLDCNDAISGMLKMLGRLIGEDIDLAWKPGSDLWPVRLDPSQLDQILANLCVNARDAIDGVGKVTIETHNVYLDDAYCADHAGFKPGQYVLLAVSDNGRGIDRESIAKIFEPFYTTKEKGKGTGLGLSTIFGIVKQNAGFVNVYSEPGRGTTFRIYLPRHSGGQEPIGEASAEVADLRGQGERILVVEDERVILSVATRMLEELQYTVLTAKTPAEALTLAADDSVVIDLLLTDVVMPEMNGRELAALLQKHRSGLRCLYMSGYTANVIAHHGVLDHDVVFLAKPFSKETLGRKVREVLNS